MSTDLRLVVFDVDGTLVDSQADIAGAMRLAFEAEGLTPPALPEILGIVGLSLDVAMPVLAPDAAPATHTRLVQGYKDAYMSLRAQAGAAVSSPLYPGAMACLKTLHAQPNTILGVATGKSKRGLDKLIEAHGLDGMFDTQQVADFHPSKPHPAMLKAAMDEIGVGSAQTVMIGDTSFDMEMATAARVPFIGVRWGYHSVDRLHLSTALLEDFAELPDVLAQHWRAQT
jgi:phosphoglycolate phosphatase